MDPLSISAGILAILDTAEKIVKYGVDFIEAIEEQRTLRQQLETFHSLLMSLLQRCRDETRDQSDPRSPSPWLRLLWEEHGHWDKNRVWVYEYTGYVAQLKQVIDRLSTRLTPSKRLKFFSNSELCVRATWHWKKDNITETKKNIAECCAMITMILQLSSDATMKELLDSVKRNDQRSQNQLTNIASLLETKDRRDEERREAKKASKEREEITDWLSPLNFRGKQEKLWSTCFQETGDWLWQDQRFKVWAQGSPWYLQWFVSAQPTFQRACSPFNCPFYPCTSQPHSSMTTNTTSPEATYATTSNANLNGCSGE